MKTRLLYIVILICSVSFFSCTGQSQDSDSIIPMADSVNTDENYKTALHEQLSEIKQENERAEQHEKEMLDKWENERETETYQTKEEAAPYGYNQWGEPYASLDYKNLDIALDAFEKARLNYIKALDVRDPMAIMYYHQQMKLEIDNCLYYANSIGDMRIIKKLKEYERMVDNLDL